MDIFTDASLNDREKIAGVGVVFVSPLSPESVVCSSTYCSTSRIETAELFAIAMALRLASRQRKGEIRVYTDSVNALRKIQSIFSRPNQNQIREVDDLMQKRILYNISASFTRMRNVAFSFCHVNGHQKKAEEYSEGYYNTIADEEAETGRSKGENVRMKDVSGKLSTFSSAEEEIIFAQQECLIVAPRQISFNYEDINTKPKVISHSKKGKEKICPRNTGRGRGCRG